MDYLQIIKAWSEWAAERTQINPLGHSGIIHYAMQNVLLEISNNGVPVQISKIHDDILDKINTNHENTYPPVI